MYIQFSRYAGHLRWKIFKRGVAYHTMMPVAMTMLMKFESILGYLSLGSVLLQCRQLMEALHLSDTDIVNIMQIWKRTGLFT